MVARKAQRWMCAATACAVVFGATCGTVNIVRAQAGSSPTGAAMQGATPVNFRVEKPAQRMEMIVHSSRILTLDNPVPRLLVNNPDVVNVRPLSPNQIQVSALRTGVTQVNLWDDKNQIFSLDVVVIADARELQELLQTEFPEASVRVRPLANSVVLTGYVPSPDMVSRIVRMSEDYYSNVINNMTVGGVQQILLHVQIMEVSRSKLRTLGMDWAAINGNDFLTMTAGGVAAPTGLGGVLAGTGRDTMRFGIVGENAAFFGFVEALRQNNLAKLLAEPTLVTVSGRPASFNVGGEFPILVPQSLGTVSIEYRQFGTRVDFVPIVLGNGAIRLEVRPQITERDDANGVNGVPALTSRWVDTAVEMKPGQTLALAGLIQNRMETENRGIPVLADVPWFGAAFRRVRHLSNEIELLIVVRPELAEAVDADAFPKCLPGSFTRTPDALDLFGRGYMEVPKCCEDGACSQCRGGEVPAGTYEEIAPPAGAPLPDAARRQTPAPVTTPRREAPSTVQTSQPTPQNRQNRPAESPPPARMNVGGEPQLIGPIGYDVLDLKQQ